ncbi:hypothetical protein LTS08_000756 [Lithohypha guttulata]|uniref:uncharacterized protein n=1 Tax=Lithohypha guttulata TaxID=1690604 RepID=UPI002DDF5E32|nr:hypothetical protein LTR51_006634 [Lithohypha guttulata]KAK5106635.1 hypothetical protein LTS08_000756 [Lithohypha guttulata]
MSEGRTPTATLTQQRRLEPDDVDILHQIVIRAQNDPVSEEKPKDALLQAYGEIFDERRLSQHQDRACFDTLLKLLNPATPGESLYHKFENILQEEGIVLSYDDDATTHDPPTADDEQLSIRADSEPLRQASEILAGAEEGVTETVGGHDDAQAIKQEAWLDSPPLYVNHLLQQAKVRDRAVLAKQTLDAWRYSVEQVRNRQLEARADALYELRLKRKVLKQCLAVFEDLHNCQVQADQIYHHNLARNALGKTTDEYRVRRVSSMDEDRVKGLSLYKWTMASRETNFIRKKDRQLKAMIMYKLVDIYRVKQAKEAQLQGLLHQRNVQNQQCLLRAVVTMMGEKSAIAKADEARADLQNCNTLCLASINAWRVKMGKLAGLDLTAEDAREYFLMKRVLRCLRSATQFRKDRRSWLAIWTARKWQDFVKARKHARYDEAYRQMRRTIKMNLGRRLLLLWQQKLRDNQEEDLKADAIYQTSLRDRIVRPFVEASYDRLEWSQENSTRADRKADEFLQKRALAAIRMRQQLVLDMSDKADRLQQYRMEQRAVQALRQMQLRGFELQRRQSDADAFRGRHDKRAVRSMLAQLRHVFVQRRIGSEGALNLMSVPAVTPARKREELLLNSSTRLSTTPAYTPFAMRLRQGLRTLENIDDQEEDDTEDSQVDALDEDTVL